MQNQPNSLFVIALIIRDLIGYKDKYLI